MKLAGCSRPLPRCMQISLALARAFASSFIELLTDSVCVRVRKRALGVIRAGRIAERRREVCTYSRADLLFIFFFR